MYAQEMGKKDCVRILEAAVNNVIPQAPPPSSVSVGLYEGRGGEREHVGEG